MEISLSDRSDFLFDQRFFFKFLEQLFIRMNQFSRLIATLCMDKRQKLEQLIHILKSIRSFGQNKHFLSPKSIPAHKLI